MAIDDCNRIHYSFVFWEQADSSDCWQHPCTALTKGIWYLIASHRSFDWFIFGEKGMIHLFAMIEMHGSCVCVWGKDRRHLLLASHDMQNRHLVLITWFWFNCVLFFTGTRGVQEVVAAYGTTFSPLLPLSAAVASLSCCTMLSLLLLIPIFTIRNSCGSFLLLIENWWYGEESR